MLVKMHGFLFGHLIEWICWVFGKFFRLLIRKFLVANFFALSFCSCSRRTVVWMKHVGVCVSMYVSVSVADATDAIVVVYVSPSIES